ncbi:MAG: class II fructose-bisphosphate aldolase [Patescibacteria group bacterium]
MIVHIKEIIKKAQKGNYAIGAFNTINLETTIGILRAAQKMKSPVIIQISPRTIEYAGLETIMGIIENVARAEAKNIPIAVHLDHGKSFEIVKQCVDAGFSSVHLDASEFDFEKNMALTKKAVDYAHRHGVWAQGELGRLFGQEGLIRVILPKNPDEYMTDPAKAKEFVQKTGVDTLAVSIGAMHGHFTGQEKIDFNRLTEIIKKVKNPLVLHGGSGVKTAEIRKAIKLGIRIINLDTDLRLAFTTTLRQTLRKIDGSHDPRKILAPSIEAVEKTVETKIKILGGLK